MRGFVNAVVGGLTSGVGLATFLVNKDAVSLLFLVITYIVGRFVADCEEIMTGHDNL